MIKRRQFIAGLGSAATWPVVARTQQRERIRYIGVFLDLAADDPESPRRIVAFTQRLAELGWSEGRNVRFEFRFGAGDAARFRSAATELVALAPDIILAHGGPMTGLLQQATRTTPIVFVNAADPVAAGYVASLARPGGNIAGFTQRELGFAAKWLELLKRIAPNLIRAAVIRDPTIVSTVGMVGAIEGVAPSLGVELTLVDSREPETIERGVKGFARGANDGLLVIPSPSAIVHRETIVAIASRYRLPAVYPYRFFVTSGGLISYGNDVVDLYRQAATYVDRILKGANPADLPVQLPSKYEMAINLKTANALGLTIPETLLATADEVIQ
jgi:putative ABC transport system substrate-binding protein